MSSRLAMIQWYIDREGKVTYSRENKHGPESYDSASAMFSALNAGGFLAEEIKNGSLDYLVKLDQVLLHQIRYTDRQKGDIMITGFRFLRGLKENAYCGVLGNHDQIWTCCESLGGIGRISAMEVAKAGTRWYRLREPYYRVQLKPILPPKKGKYAGECE